MFRRNPTATRQAPLCLTLLVVGACGRSGFSGLIITPMVTVDTPRVVNANDTALVTGSCAEGLPVQSEGAPAVPCDAGRFIFQTPVASSDGVRVYVLFQTSGEETAEASVTWVRNADPPSLALDQPTIINGLDTAVFKGNCTSLSGAVRVSPTNDELPCANDRFSFTTPSAMTDDTRLYAFSQTNAAAVTRQTVGTWIRNIALPRLVLDAPLIANGDDTATFTGDCSSLVGTVTVDDAGTVTSVACDVAGRFSHETAVRSSDALRTYVFSQQATTGEIVSVIGRWSREAVPALLSTSGVQAQSTFGDAVAIDGDVLLVGAPTDDGAANNAGAVFIYHHGDAGWGSPSVLRPASPRAGEMFGEDVAFVNGIAVVGAPGTATVAGRVYAFAYSDGAWTELTYFERNVLSFGNRVAFDGSVLAVRSREDVGGAVEAGAVYLYGYGTPNWLSYGRVTSPVPKPQGNFGTRVEVADGWLMVLAFQPDTPSLFRLTSGAWIHHTGSADFPALAPPIPFSVEFYNATSMIADRFAIVYPPGDGAAVFKRAGELWEREENFPMLASTLGSAVAIRGDDLILVQDTAPTTVLHYRFGPSGWVQQSSLVLPESDGDLSDCVISSGAAVACTGELSELLYVWRLPRP